MSLNQHTPSADESHASILSIDTEAVGVRALCGEAAGVAVALEYTQERRCSNRDLSSLRVSFMSRVFQIIQHWTLRTDL